MPYRSGIYAVLASVAMLLGLTGAIFTTQSGPSTGDVTSVLGVASGAIDVLKQTCTNFTLADATPDIATTGKMVYCATDSTVFTDFVDTDGDHSEFTPEHRFLIILWEAVDGGLDCGDSATLSCNGGVDWTAEVNDIATCLYDPTAGIWTCAPSAPTGARSLSIPCTPASEDCDVGVYLETADPTEAAANLCSLRIVDDTADGTMKWFCNGGAIATVLSDTGTSVDTFFWPAGAINTDGTQCAAASVSANTLIPQPTIVCADNDGGILYGSATMPDAWDGGTVVFRLAISQVAASTNTIELDFGAQCVSSDEAQAAFAAPPTGEQPASITLTADNDDLLDDTPAVTVAGTTCAGGDRLYWTGQVDATASSADIATAVEITGVSIEFTTSLAGD